MTRRTTLSAASRTTASSAQCGCVAIHPRIRAGPGRAPRRRTRRSRRGTSWHRSRWGGPRPAHQVRRTRLFWQGLTAEPLDRSDFETGLCGSVSVPPQVLGALISRQIDSDDVLTALSVPTLVTHGLKDQIVLPRLRNTSCAPAPTRRHPGTTWRAMPHSSRTDTGSTMSWPSWLAKRADPAKAELAARTRTGYAIPSGAAADLRTKPDRTVGP